jgi:GTPase
MLLVDTRLVMPTGLPRPADKPLLDIYASIVVDRDSRKGIVIGHRAAGSVKLALQSAKQIEALLGTPVYLDLRVKVLKEWQRDAKYLNRPGCQRRDDSSSL